jgi:hypothetical protein
MMIRLIIGLFLLITLSCNQIESSVNNDCLTENDNIQRSTRPSSFEILPNSFEDCIIILDTVLSSDEKTVFKCTDENTLMKGEPFNDIWMWAHNKFKLGSKHSPIGQIIREQEIYWLKGTAILAVLYHRHLNNDELKKEELFADYRIRNLTNGRISSVEMSNKLTEFELAKLIQLANMVDSLMSNNIPSDINTLLIEKGLPQDRMLFIENRNQIFQYCRTIRENLSNEYASSNELEELFNITKYKVLNSFEDLSLGKKLIEMEKLKLLTIQIN